jgi:DNA polymerase III alpha subunit
MGFYAPAQLIADARTHGVGIRPADVTVSGWDCVLEAADGKVQVRMPGRRYARPAHGEGHGQATAQRIGTARASVRSTTSTTWPGAPGWMHTRCVCWPPPAR